MKLHAFLIIILTLPLLAPLAVAQTPVATTSIKLFEDTGVDLYPGSVIQASLEVSYKAFLGAVWAGEVKLQVGPVHARIELKTSTFTGKDTFYLVVLIHGKQVLKEKLKELGPFSTGSGKVSAALLFDADCNGKVKVKYNDKVIGSFSIPKGTYFSILKEENGDASVKVQLLEEYNCAPEETSTWVYKKPPNKPPSSNDDNELQLIALGLGALALVVAVAAVIMRRG